MKNYTIKNIYLLAVCILTCIHTFGQKENENWVFGNSIWTFNDNNPNGFDLEVIDNRVSAFGTASISNPETGQLLFYTNGIRVFDRNGNLMQNGDELFGDAPQDSETEAFYFTVDFCEGNRTNQPVVIVPFPGNPNLYYIFSSARGRNRVCTQGVDLFYNLGLRYAIVDVTQNGGLGNVITKNNIIQNDGTRGLTTTLSNDGSFYWLVTEGFNVYKIDDSGIDSTPIVSDLTGAFGTIKISPNGNHLLASSNSQVFLYDFNTTTGEVSNPIDVLSSDDSAEQSCLDGSQFTSSAEFSPDNNIIYLVGNQSGLGLGGGFLATGLCMYNISSNQLIGGIDDNGTYLYSLPFGDDSTLVANMQLGPDDKIYLIFNGQSNNDTDDSFTDITFDSNNWGVIENPNIWNPPNHPISPISAPIGTENGIMFPQLIPIIDIPSCLEDLIITENVTSGEVDIQESSNSITALNTVSNNATAEYDAGNEVILSPGFRALPGSTFRAFIEGCTPTRNSSNFRSINEETAIIKEVDKIEKTLTVFPNPTRNTINIESKDEIVSIQLINQIGNIRASEQSLQNNRKTSFDLSNYPAGIYFLRVTFKDGEIMNKTIVKQ